MNIRSTFVWTSLHTLIKILSGIIMNKIIAVYLGPAGLALLGQFQNFSQLAVNVASGSIHTGIVKYTAEHKESQNELDKAWNNALFITFILSMIVITVLVVFSDYLSNKVLFSYDYKYVIIFFASSIFLYVLNMYILAILNGLQNITLYTTINILTSISTLVVVSILTLKYKMIGALYALVITQVLVFIGAFFLMYRKYNLYFFNVRNISRNLDRKTLKNLLDFGAVSFVSGVTMSLMLLAVRYIIQEDVSLEYAGYWEALWKISVYFTMLGILPASIYYLPKFSALDSVNDIKKLLFESIGFFIPIQLCFALVLYLFRLDIIELLFTKEFLVISSALLYMLAGDVIRVLAYLIVNIMYAKKFLKKLILLDVSYFSLLVFLVYISFDQYGLISLGYSYLCANFFVLVYVLVFYFNIDKHLECQR